MALAIECRATAELLLGGPKTGKTRMLAERAATLASDRAAAGGILVLVASPDAATCMLASFGQMECGESVRVATPREIALEVLSRPEARAYTGRSPRLLARYEESFLMEDMKVSGLRPKRIRELTNFFYRSWTELSDWNEDWLIFKEEEEAHGLLKSLLGSYEAYVEPEVVNAAVRWLASDGRALSAASAPCVLVDDYQCLSRASQHLAVLLARERLIVASNPAACATRFESYPYGPGVTELRESVPGVSVAELRQSALSPGRAEIVNKVSRVARRSLDDGASSSPNAIEGCGRGELQFIEASDPADECAQAVTWVLDALESGMRPCEVAVTVPNKTWERNIATGLAQAGVAAERTSSVGDVGGDIRYLDLSLAAQFSCLATLAADRHDAPSLRAWCGFGEYLTNRSAFSEIFAIGRDRDCSLAEVVEAVALGVERGEDDADFPLEFMAEARKIAARYRLLETYLEKLEGLKGPRLVQEIASLVSTEGGVVPPMAAGLVADTRPEDDAAAIVARMVRGMHFSCASDEDSVKIVSMRRVSALEAKAVAHMGLVNGFYPPRAYFDRTKTSPERAGRMLSDGAKLLCEALGQGADRSAVFSFASIRGVDAEQLGLHVDRFSVHDGVRQARVSRSEILSEAGV